MVSGSSAHLPPRTIKSINTVTGSTPSSTSALPTAADLAHLTFPTTIKVDFIRVYQLTDAINVGCDPVGISHGYLHQPVRNLLLRQGIMRLTVSIIGRYMEAYTNQHLKTWRDDFKKPFPRAASLVSKFICSDSFQLPHFIV